MQVITINLNRLSSPSKDRNCKVVKKKCILKPSDAEKQNKKIKNKLISQN